MIQCMVIFLSSLFMCSTVFAASAASVSLGVLSSTLNERMLIMRDVAGYKEQHHLPVEDLDREKDVLANMMKNAQKAGLEQRSVEPFVYALMNAGKAIQYRYLANWLTTPDSTPVRDLLDTRKQIEQTDNRMMVAISQRLMAGPFTDADKAWLAEQMTAPNLSKADKNCLISGLVPSSASTLILNHRLKHATS